MNTVCTIKEALSRSNLDIHKGSGSIPVVSYYPYCVKNPTAYISVGLVGTGLKFHSHVIRIFHVAKPCISICC